MTTAALTLRDIAPADWHALTDGFRDLTYEQTRAYSEPAAVRVGGTARFVALEQDGRVVALAALRVRNLPGLRRGIIWVPAGPMVLAPGRPDPEPAELSLILHALRRQLVAVEGNILRLRFSALTFLTQEAALEVAQSAGFAPTGRAQRYKTYALDLHQPEDEIMRKLNGKWRNSLRNARKGGLTVDRTCDLSLTDRFEKVFASVQEAKGFAPVIAAAFHRECRAGDYQLETFVICRDGVDLGAGMMVVTGKNANYLFGATNEAGRPLRAGYQLTWSMIQRGQELGLAWLDLGGVDFEANPDVAGYKERTGALYVEGAGPFESAPAGLFPKVVNALEDLRARLKSRGKG